MIEEQTLTVSQLTRYIRQIFESEEMLFNIPVVGEISGFKLVRGIAYFDLKDENALISCVCFNGEQYADFKNGSQVVAKGTPNFYMKGGKLNFNVSNLTLYGVGNLFQQFIELKNKLEKEGLFDESVKYPIPSNVKKIGVISSKTGAVIRDIINVATRRNPAVNIVLYPAKVQGEGSAQSIINGLDFFENYDVDVVIIARGGGSLEDLNEFNNELLARKIFSTNKCIVSAVGHETDFTICDFVSDKRAPTPSAGAELVVENILAKTANFNMLKSRLLATFKHFKYVYQNKITAFKTRIVNLAETIVSEKEYELGLKTTKLVSLNPNLVLKRGYARLEKLGKVISSVTELKQNDIITINLKDGSVEGEIK